MLMLTRTLYMPSHRVTDEQKVWGFRAKLPARRGGAAAPQSQIPIV